MTDHRRLQRGLFRMQMDPAFAARVFAREPDATATLGLAAGDLALVLALDPAAVAADAHGRRKDQLLGNLASEYGLTAAVGPDDLLPGFLDAPEFHDAIRTDRLLPVAFGSYAARVAHDTGERRDDGLAALVELERAMVALRRRREPGSSSTRYPAPEVPPPAGADELHLSPRAALVRLRAGTLAWAAALRDALRMRLPHPTPDLADLADLADPANPSGGSEETVLLLAAESSPHALPDVRPEVLEPAVALFLERARQGLGRGARAGLAADLGAAPEELEAFAETLVADGVLVRR